MAIAAPDLYFAVNSHFLTSRERHKLARSVPAIQDILHDFPDLIIVIEAYADDWFSSEYNERLASERADAVRRIFLNLNFPEDCLRVASFSYRAPQCTGQDDRCKQGTRRVHFRAAVAIPFSRETKP
jgi:outer membrane protein OmpA-like peptidoglycan-associated protein